MENLLLSEIWRPKILKDYKVHFARYNQYKQPLNVLAGDMDEWKNWQEWYPDRNDFNRKYIFSLAQYPHAPDHWLFGGVWEVKGIVERDLSGKKRKFYDVNLVDHLRPMVRRLKLRRVWKQRGTRVNFENHYHDFEIAEIFPQSYSGIHFPGFDNINISFSDLKLLVNNAREDWNTALTAVKGIYLISDDKTGMKYVGSAYGTGGVWSRWLEYIALGHAGNKGMKELLKGKDLTYCENYFRFSLLEILSIGTEDRDVIKRESHWKEVLGTREHGLNHN